MTAVPPTPISGKADNRPGRSRDGIDAVKRHLEDTERGTLASPGSELSRASGALTGRSVNSSMDISRPVSKQDMKDAMLGYSDLNRSITADGRELFREEFCGSCGTIHSKPDLLHVYYACKLCHCVLREPAKLRSEYAGVKMTEPFEILFATYGDPFDPDYSIDVTERVRALVRGFSASDRLSFKPAIPADAIFGCDPRPGHNKQLRARYRIDKIHGTLALDFDASNRIPIPFLMLVPKNRYLKIHHAIYGHPKGVNKSGRMSIDVTELIQSLVDQMGGSYLSISSYTPLARLLGDPCPGYCKDLRIGFEVRGRSGEINYTEVRGHLKKPIFISSSPTVAPIVYVATATYGVTPTARRDRLDIINKLLKKIRQIEHRLREGFRLQPEEVKLYKTRKSLIAQRDLFMNVPTNFVDISVKVQKMADEGGIRFLIDRNEFDPNFTFGNPSPGTPKILEVLLDCQGHDAERTTDSAEVMDTGFSRNYITVKRGRYNILVEDDPVTGQGVMQESLDFRTDVATPVIVITRATYGEIARPPATEYNSAKIIDVTNDVQAQVRGRSLSIGREVNLNKLFRWDPAPGKRKQLNIKYLTKGFMGNLRVREKDDVLVAGIELGYPPVPPPDDEDFVVN